MAGSELLLERLGLLARDLRSEESPSQTLEHVVQAAVDLIGPCKVAGISLAQRDGGIRTSAASSDLATRSDLLQVELHEGPCVDAVWQDTVVSVPDLESDRRWPRWRVRALAELGIGSMLCLRLFTHEDRLGALNLFASDAEAFTDDDEQEAIALAAHAAVAMAASENVDQLQNAIGNRTVIGQATGLTMHRFGLTDEQAFHVLRRLSNEQNQKLSTISRELVEDWNASGHD